MLARFVIAGPLADGSRIALEDDELHHAARVLRVRAGERIEVFDGRGWSAQATVVTASKGSVEIEIAGTIDSRECPVEITLAAALIAPDKYELVLQKGCELGVARFQPVVTHRIETRVDRVLGKYERWHRIILEAIKQCGRSTLPRLEEPIDFEEVLGWPNVIAFDADEGTSEWPSPPLDRVTLVIGPEGGLTPEEIDNSRRRGAAVCPLGPRRLRAETAAIAAVSLAGARYGDLRA